jgi:hypothetical protein
MYAVMDIDFRFEELVKLISLVPDEMFGAPPMDPDSLHRRVREKGL